MYAHAPESGRLAEELCAGPWARLTGQGILDSEPDAEPGNREDPTEALGALGFPGQQAYVRFRASGKASWSSGLDRSPDWLQACPVTPQPPLKEDVAFYSLQKEKLRHGEGQSRVPEKPSGTWRPGWALGLSRTLNPGRRTSQELSRPLSPWAG